MKKLLFILVFLLPLAVFAKPSYEELNKHNVKIYGKNPLTATDWEWTGSGVIVKQYKGINFILTNRHVVLGAEAFGYHKMKTDNKLTDGTIVSFYLPSDIIVKIGDEEYKAKVIRVSEVPEQDMAIIIVKGRLGDKTAIPGVQTSKISDLVYSVGNPAGIPDVYGEGLVSGRISNWLYVQIPTIGGQSGSGIYDNNGMLTGLIFAGLSGDSARGLAVDSLDIIPFIMDIFYK